jgi:hypothetical protein
LVNGLLDHDGDWARIRGRRLDNHMSFVRVISWSKRLAIGMPALIKPLNKLGLGKIAWAALDTTSTMVGESIFAHRTYSRCPRQILRAALAGDTACMIKVGCAVSFNWGMKGSDSGATIYPAFMDWSIGAGWFSRAAASGNVEAQSLLEQMPNDRGRAGHYAN